MPNNILPSNSTFLLKLNAVIYSPLNMFLTITEAVKIDPSWKLVFTTMRFKQISEQTSWVHYFIYAK